MESPILSPHQCPIKISDRKKRDDSDKSLNCQTIHQKMKNNVDVLCLVLLFLLPK